MSFNPARQGAEHSVCPVTLHLNVYLAREMSFASSSKRDSSRLSQEEHGLELDIFGTRWIAKRSKPE